MLRALYEILVPVDKMMELVSAVIPSRIMASVGKYTMPWIIDRAVSALLLTNSWPGLKEHIILRNISTNMAATPLLSLGHFQFLSSPHPPP